MGGWKCKAEPVPGVWSTCLPHSWSLFTLTGTWRFGSPCLKRGEAHGKQHWSHCFWCLPCGLWPGVQCVVGVGGLGVSSVWAGLVIGLGEPGGWRIPGLCLGSSLGRAVLSARRSRTLPRGSAPFIHCLGWVPAARPLLKLGKSSGSVVIFISNRLFSPSENVVRRNEISDVCVSALIFLFVITHPAYLL